MDDISTSKIVTGFYKYLSRGYSKDKALRKAKLDYLNSVDKVHEHAWFWSGIVITGDPERMYFPFYIKLIVVCVISIIVILVMVKKIRNRNNSGIRGPY